MPKGPKGEKRPAGVSGNAVHAARGPDKPSAAKERAA